MDLELVMMTLVAIAFVAWLVYGIIRLIWKDPHEHHGAP